MFMPPANSKAIIMPPRPPSAAPTAPNKATIAAIKTAVLNQLPNMTFSYCLAFTRLF